MAESFASDQQPQLCRKDALSQVLAAWCLPGCAVAFLCVNSDKKLSRYLCKCQRDIEGLEPANLNPKRIPFGPKGGLELGDSSQTGKNYGKMMDF